MSMTIRFMHLIGHYNTLNSTTLELVKIDISGAVP